MKYQRNVSFALLAIFCSVLTLFVLLDRLPIIVPVGYGALSLFAVLFYGIDKSAAKKDMWRISEAKLHLLSLFGGWPGALLNSYMGIKHGVYARATHILAAALGIAGILTLFSGLSVFSGNVLFEASTAVFGLGQIVWFILIGLHMTRTSR